MVGSIRPGSVSGAAAIGRGGSAPSGNRTGGALRKLAGSVAGRVAREFKLIDDSEPDQDDTRDHYRDGEDIYDILGTSRQLASDLGARPIDEGMLARALDSFVQESAVLLSARPGAASLDAIARVIQDHEGTRESENFDRSIAQIDQTTRGIAEASPASSRSGRD